MKSDNRTQKRKIGDIGENIACQFLKKHGFTVIERNYLRKWGEIDIVARKGSRYHFVEVKTVTLRDYEVQLQRVDVSDETKGGGVKHETDSLGHSLAKASEADFRPEDNMHPWKLKRLARTIETYMFHKKLDCEYQLDLVTVKMDMSTRQARVGLLENIVF